jgi:hypothetical protein
MWFSWYLLTYVQIHQLVLKLEAYVGISRGIALL